MNGSIAGLFASPKGGVPKLQVQSLQVTTDGCVGDFQRNKKHHGGTQRAVCLYSEEVINTLQTEGHPISLALSEKIFFFVKLTGKVSKWVANFILTN